MRVPPLLCNKVTWPAAIVVATVAGGQPLDVTLVGDGANFSVLPTYATGTHLLAGQA